MDVEPDLVAGRECGACNVCCVALTIDDPALKKPQGVRCRNALPDNHCAIYDARPHTCRSFYCGWRQLRWVRDTMRPDLSRVLVRLRVTESESAVVFTLLDRGAVDAAGFAESVAAAIGADIPTFFEIAGAPGKTYGITRVNDVFREVVLARDKPGMLRIIKRIYAVGRGMRRKAVAVA